MEPIRAYETDAALGLDDFVLRHPNAFLVHLGGPLRAVDAGATRAFTVDRLVLEAPKSGGVPTRDMQVAAVVPRDPAERVITIGVSSSCDVVINDASVSKQHAWFDRVDGWRIWDNDSVAGTHVNRTLIQPGRPHPLKSGDLISLGYVDLSFLSANAFHHLLRSLFG